MLAFLLCFSSALATFYPAQDQDMEGIYNINNVSYIYADGFCFNDGTCFGENNRIEVTMWEIALMISLIGTAFLFVYIGNQFGSQDINGKFTKIFFTGLKLLFILAAMVLPIIAISANYQIWVLSNVNTSSLQYVLDNSYLIVVWLPIIVFALIGIAIVIDWLSAFIQRRKK